MSSPHSLTPSTTRRSIRWSATALGLTFLATPVAAQVPKSFTACYVPSSGTVYRIDKPAGTAPGTPSACSASRRGSDVEFAWTDGADAIRLSSAAGGDLSGTFGSLTTAKLLGRALATTPPTAGQVLTWNALTSEWTPTTPTGGQTSHAGLSGLTADDHPQYLLTNGARAAVNGFAVGGELGVGTLVSSGPGPSLVWYPRKAAFRAGQADASGGWDDANIGAYSIALGYFPVASGARSVAFGSSAVASGDRSVALGARAVSSGTLSTSIGPDSRALGDLSIAVGGAAVASANYATAFGIEATATDLYAVAIGNHVTATGLAAVALGNYASSGYGGAFVIGDYSSSTSLAYATAANQFTGRFAGGFRFRTNIPMTTGCDLPAGSGVFSCTSSRTLKSDFSAVDGESLLAKVRAMPIMSWRYTGESADIRHIGPFAEDFRAAFGLGTDSLSIGVLDEAGIGLAGVQALERRTSALRTESELLREENIALRARLERVEAALRSREPWRR